MGIESGRDASRASAPKTTEPNADSLISVGIPVRNGAATLELALSAIVRQTHQKLEIVLSDNASTDATREICERFARADRRIRYIRHDRGMPADEHFRYVFEQCTGRWFMWASHDDLRDDNYIEVLRSGFASNPDAALVVTDTKFFSSYEAWKEGTGQPLPLISSTGIPFPERHAKIVGNGAVQIYGLFRSDVVRSYRWPKVPVGHDWLLIHWAATLGEIIYAPGSTFRYFTPPQRKTATELRLYYWLDRAWNPLDAIQIPPDFRWAIKASGEIARARRAKGLKTNRWALVPSFCFLHHGGPRAWAKTFVYRNSPEPVREALRAIKRWRAA